jgi:TPR repeat protein
MNTQESPFWYLIRKDFYYFRWAFVALWTCWIALLAFPFIRNFEIGTTLGSELSMAFLMIQMLAGIVVFFTQARLVQLDPCEGNHFLATRPVTRQTILRSKLVVWFIGIILPSTIIRIIYLALFSMNLTYQIYLLLFVESLVTGAALYAVFLIPSIATRSLGHLLTVFVGIYLVASFAGVAFSLLWGGVSSFQMTGPSTLITSRSWLIWSVALVSSLGAMFQYYRSQKWWHMLPFLCGGCLISVALASNHLWKFDFIKLVTSPNLKRSTSFNAQKIKFSLKGDPTKGSGSNNGIESIYVGSQVDLIGLDYPLFVQQTSHRSTAVFSDGAKIKSDRDENSREFIPTKNALLLLNVKSQSEIDTVQASLFSCKEKDFKSKSNKEVRLMGTVSYQIYRPMLLGEARIQEDQQFATQGLRDFIKQVSNNGKNLTVHILRESIKLSWDEKSPSFFDDNIKIIVVNQKMNQYLESGGGGGHGSGAVWGYEPKQMELNFQIPHSFQNKFQITDEWLSNARLYWFSREAVGEVSFPFEIPYFDLEKDGHGVPNLKSLRNRAERGDVAAQAKLGMLYLGKFGKNFPKDPDQGLMWLNKAAEKNSLDAQSALGDVYLDGNSMLRDITKGLDWHQKAAEQNHLASQMRLANIYRYGNYQVPVNYAEAMKWYLKVTENSEDWGTLHAQLSIGDMYAKGQGVEKSPQKAVEWYRKVANRDFAEGFTRLGVMYRKGEGVSKDYVEAYKWFSKAAGYHDLEAYVYLGLMHMHGEGVARDYAEAYKWFALGKEHREYLNEDLKDEFNKAEDTLNKQLTPVEIEEGKRRALEFRKAERSRTTESEVQTIEYKVSE